MQETKVTWVQSLGWEDPLEKGITTHSSTLVWRIPWTEESGGLPTMRSQRVRHDWSNLARTVQFSSVSQSCLSLCAPRDCSMPGFPVHHQFLELVQTHFHQVGGAIQPAYPLSSPSPPFFNVSQYQGLFQWVSSSYQVAKYWNFSFSISPSNEYAGLISFKIDCFDLLSVKGALRSLLQHHSLKVSIFRCSTFFIVQLSHPYMTTGKTIALTIQTFVRQRNVPAF